MLQEIAGAGEEAARLVNEAADRTIVLEKPAYFRAVAQGYENWYDVPDEEVANILKTYNQPNSKG